MVHAWWRCGESNPGPLRYQRRHLRAQPAASVSDRASSRWHMTPPDLVRFIFRSQSRHPGSGNPLTTPDTGRWVTTRADGLHYLCSQGEVVFGTYWLYRLFNEDSGNLGSLPSFQVSASKPVHPQGDCLPRVYNAPSTVGIPVISTRPRHAARNRLPPYRRPRCRKARSISRCCSRLRIVWRLSRPVLPFARASSIFAFPALK